MNISFHFIPGTRQQQGPKFIVKIRFNIKNFKNIL